jgi:hypothetical protein
MAKTTKVTDNYQANAEINLESKIVFPATRLNKKYSDLTDADIEAVIAKGNKHFSKITVAVLPSSTPSPVLKVS